MMNIHQNIYYPSESETLAESRGQISSESSGLCIQVGWCSYAQSGKLTAGIKKAKAL